MSSHYHDEASNSPRKRHTTEIIIILLVLLSVVGIALTDISPNKGFWFWMAMGPVFCGAGIAVQWPRLTRRNESKTPLIRNQILHWFGYLLAVYLIFILSGVETGRLNNVDVGLVALLILAFAAFTAGITANWRISIVGVFLGIAVCAITWLEEYIWAILVPLALIIIGFFIFRSRKSSLSRKA